jgi:abortive infection bacteriophage resistance protein
MATYDKPHLTHAEQVRHLKAKGMTFEDESLAMEPTQGVRPLQITPVTKNA